MSRKKSYVGRNSEGSKSKGGTKHAKQLAARDRRTSLEPVAQLEPTSAPLEPDQPPADWISPTNAASALRAEADAPDLAPPSKLDPTTEEQRDVRRTKFNAAALRRNRALRKERLAEEAVAATVERRALARSPVGVHL
ncbi:hypothetical protein T492DRAFT_853031 [Pavlovales sp. CCMP2436]|nr:hypothetical protein T492DRAFT_853031 [Pavlovales sp. CCMP2436]